MATSWSTRRKMMYAAILLVVAGLAVGVPSFLTFYKAPTCFDGKQNGGEQGTDCGGPCEKLCSSSFLALPGAQWVRYKEMGPHIYNVAAYIVNPNQNGRADNVPYKIEFLDKDGVTIHTITGMTNIPPARNTLIFKYAVDVGIQTPARAILTFTSAPDWYKASDPLTMVQTTSKDYVEENGTSGLTVKLSNSSVSAIKNVTVYAILKDKDANVIDFSKTVVDSIPPRGSATAPFTWPVDHAGQVISIEVLPVAE